MSFPVRSSKPIKILLPVFENYNVLDLNGPLEVFHNSSIGEGATICHIAAANFLTRGVEAGSIKRDVSFDELLANGAQKLKEYDILVQPGAPPKAITDLFEPGNEDGVKHLQVIETFKKLGANRWLVSICSGAYFLGKTGAFDGMQCTTHFRVLDALQGICDDWAKANGGKGAKVIRKRWVDGGINQWQTRVVSAGGVSCGMDCSLWVHTHWLSEETAKASAEMMEYAWRGADDV